MPSSVDSVTSPATYDTVPLQVEVGIMSSHGRRYLELLGKLDQLMPLLQTLEIHEVVTTQAVERMMPRRFMSFRIACDSW